MNTVLPFSGPGGDGPSMVSTNPAGLMRLPWGWYLHVEGLGRIDQYQIRRELTDPLDGSTSTRTTDDAPMSWGTSISFVIASRRASVAFRGPHVAPAQRAPTSAALDPFAGGSELQTISWAGGAVSIAPISRLLIGVLVELTQTRATLRFGQDTALAAGRDPLAGIGSPCGGTRCGLEHPQAMSAIDIDVISRDVNWAFTLGTQLRLGNASWLGLAYRIPPGGFSSDVVLSGDATVTAAPRDGDISTATRARVKLYMPHWLTLSYSTQLRPTLTALVDLRLAYNERAGDYDIRLFGNGYPEDRGWINRYSGLRDTARLALGVERTDSGQRLVAGGRLTFDSGATAKANLAPTNVEPASVTLAAAARLRLTPYVVFELDYGLRAYRATSVARSNYDPSDAIACQDSGYDYTRTACGKFRNGFAIGAGAGDYERYTHLLRASLRLTLR